MIEQYFQKISNNVAHLLSIFLNSEARVYWLYLAASLIIAVGILWLRKQQRHSDHEAGFNSVLHTLFDKDIWFHKSAKLDYFCYVINALGGAVLVFSSLGIGAFTGTLFQSLLLSLNSGVPLSVSANTLTLSAYTAFSLVILDLGLYCGHYLLHKIPALWELHKVHHSAQVLTPMTVFRIHPLDFAFAAFVSGIFFGLASAVGIFVFGEKTSVLTILGLNAGVFIFNLVSANLRHSHVWIAYPVWLSKILISPAQHQIHHSKLPQHFDRNFGVIFAVWDRIFNTLYIPGRNEQVPFGLWQDEDEDYQSVLKMYFVPLKKLWQLWGKQVKKH